MFFSEKSQLQQNVEKLLTELEEVREKCEEMRAAKQVRFLGIPNAKKLLIQLIFCFGEYEL